MTTEQIRATIQSPDYDFLRKEPRLGDNIMFLTVAGSHAYGTNVETSDLDIRGCAFNSRSDLIGLSNFEQFINNATDTTVYGFNKLINLLLNCNPNTIELLGCKPDHYLMMNEAGKALIANRKMFLSQRAAYSFGGYATQQLKRLENALARDKLPQGKAEQHILHSAKNAVAAFEVKHVPLGEGGMKLYVDKSSRDDLDYELFCDVNINKYPARDFQTMINTLSAVIRDYEKTGHRNHKKDDAHLNKHAMHLVRLYLMCIDILENEEIKTYRSDEEREVLLNIRNGLYQNEDGTYQQEFFDRIEDLEKLLDYAKKNTSLPSHPDMKRIEEFVMDINASSLNKGFTKEGVMYDLR